MATGKEIECADTTHQSRSQLSNELSTGADAILILTDRQRRFVAHPSVQRRARRRCYDHAIVPAEAFLFIDMLFTPPRGTRP